MNPAASHFKPFTGGPMKAKTVDGVEIDLSPQSIAGLKARLRGPLLAPGDPSNMFRTNRNIRPGMTAAGKASA
jgi:hypothetical protein